MATGTKERHTRLVGTLRTWAAPPPSPVRWHNRLILNVNGLFLESVFYFNSCALAGFECTEGAGPLSGTTAGLTGQLLLFMELFTA